MTLTAVLLRLRIKPSPAAVKDTSYFFPTNMEWYPVKMISHPQGAVDASLMHVSEFGFLFRSGKHGYVVQA